MLAAAGHEAIIHVQYCAHISIPTWCKTTHHGSRHGHLIADLNCIRSRGWSSRTNDVLYPKCVACRVVLICIAQQSLLTVGDRDLVKVAFKVTLRIVLKQTGKKGPRIPGQVALQPQCGHCRGAQQRDQMRCERRTRAVSSSAQ
ncbi:hypothetical protein F442_20232 [Phytophthora nicotianae P10297]|uniref:Uncharacterized protein n=1 Tax=Phytophthora nicotianae P10297 TaxID=1317064 RepID=W2Y875_PHYNI|nr:hypothetical protein F442_20232 [Phytophthora nicotianae P10297]